MVQKEFYQYGNKYLGDAPDMIIIQNNEALFVEHFEFDCYYFNRKGSQNRGLPVEKEDIDRLRGQKLVEGRLTSLYLLASEAKSIDESTTYIKNKGFDDKYYKDLIVEYLKQYGKAKKKDIRELLWHKLPNVLSDNQKENKIHNLLASLKKQGIIGKDSENQQQSNWILM